MKIKLHMTPSESVECIRQQAKLKSNSFSARNSLTSNEDIFMEGVRHALNLIRNNMVDVETIDDIMKIINPYENRVFGFHESPPEVGVMGCDAASDDSEDESVLTIWKTGEHREVCTPIYTSDSQKRDMIRNNHHPFILVVDYGDDEEVIAKCNGVIKTPENTKEYFYVCPKCGSVEYKTETMDRHHIDWICDSCGYVYHQQFPNE